MNRNKPLYERVKGPAYTGFLLFSVLLFCSFNTGWNKISQIDVYAKDMETDNLGNIYVVSQTNQLYKYDAGGRLLSTLNYAYTGNITHLDVSNPLEIYLFYREMNTIVFLDNNLAFRGKINLADAGIIQASAAARSYANGIWVFDAGDLQLKKIGKDGLVSQLSGNALQFISGKTIAPDLIRDNGSRVFVNDSTEGILVFDVFANYRKTIPVTGLMDFDLEGDFLKYLSDGKLIRYNMSVLKRDTLAIPADTAVKVRFINEKVITQGKSAIRVYTSSH